MIVEKQVVVGVQIVKTYWIHIMVHHCLRELVVEKHVIHRKMSVFMDKVVLVAAVVDVEPEVRVVLIFKLCEI